MDLQHYPAQEPLSPLGAAYHQRVLARGAGQTGLAFAYGADPYQSLTVFPAPEPNGDVLVFFHGGGWTSGYREWMHCMAPALTARGVTLVCPGYRLAPSHIFPACRDDAADAVAWVSAYIALRGGNPRRIFVGGHSAGGHLASLLAVKADWRERRGLPTQVLRGCLPVSGVYRFGSGSGLSARPRFLGAQDDGTTERAASPLLQLTPSACPPFLIAYGDRDFPHLQTQAQEMRQALQQQQIAVECLVLENCDHFDASLACADEAADGWPVRAAQWMRRIGASDH